MVLKKRKSFIKKENRPIVHIKFTRNDYISESLSIIAFLAMWLLTFYAIVIASLPDTIPIHFNLKGTPDGYGKKLNLLITPLVSTVIYIGMTIINRYPHLFNYPVKINEKNAVEQYLLATRIIRLIKLVIMLLFFIIEFFIIKSVLYNRPFVAFWFVLIIPAFFYVLFIFYILRSIKVK
ncbi:MAG TPA: DUF1648 domain-containing protein [Bacteroidales bacterium]|nr:DUF1648 domain-containing protein [Bacteroidales bacterium]HQF01333.1 DUF1648 domain-containing protein [Bacteroidales bacterium]HQH14428.1 DUF1648 domain-containing protein [Bacteroidales bacterium]